MAQEFPNLDFPFTQQDIITDPWRAFLRTLWERTGGISGGVSVPVGSLSMYAGSSVPDGWLLCDGAAVSRTTYSRLFSQIGTAYGSGNGFSTFNLPNLSGRFPRGAAGGPDTVGSGGGNDSVVLTTNELPPHTHSLDSVPHTHLITDPGHVHLLTDPGHIHTLTDPGHTHDIGSDTVAAAGAFVAQGLVDTGSVVTDSAVTGITVNSALTGATVDSATTGITAEPTTQGGAAGVTGLGQPLPTLPAYTTVNFIIKV